MRACRVRRDPCPLVGQVNKITWLDRMALSIRPLPARPAGESASFALVVATRTILDVARPFPNLIHLPRDVAIGWPRAALVFLATVVSVTQTTLRRNGETVSSGIIDSYSILVAAFSKRAPTGRDSTAQGASPGDRHQRNRKAPTGRDSRKWKSRPHTNESRPFRALSIFGIRRPRADAPWAVESRPVGAEGATRAVTDVTGAANAARPA